LSETFVRTNHSFPLEDRRFQASVTKLLQLVKATPGLEKEVTDALGELDRHLSGQTFGAPEALRQEREEIMNRVRDFDMTKSPAFRAFQQRQLTSRKFAEIISICEVLADQANVPMDRETKRRKPVLFKWLDTNWTRLEPCLQFLTLVCEGDVDQSLA
jgi:hypothetical protein